MSVYVLEILFVKFFLYMRFGRQSTKNSTIIIGNFKAFSCRRLRLHNNCDTNDFAARSVARLAALFSQFLN